ncbi:hypothetical protein [Amorphus sp. 3PC139-8]|uniref:hypothetical protein n=1 Tax=Amorphus sp. 3PC139-8 TaxID=2735676 RepID=UPI00345D6C46
MSRMNLALILGAAIAAAPIAASAQNNPPASVVIMLDQQRARQAPPPRYDRDPRHGRDHGGHHRYERDAYRHPGPPPRRPHYHRGPPAHAPAYGYRNGPRYERQQIVPGFYVVTPRR